MAWTRKLPSGKYQGLYRGGDGKSRTVAGGPFVHKAKARRHAEDAEHDSRKPGWKGPEAGRKTWGEWCEEWWPTRGVEESTLRSDAGYRDHHLLPQWGDVPIADINRQDIRAWAAKMRKDGAVRKKKDKDGNPVLTPLSAASVQVAVHILSASLSAAVDANIITANPTYRLKLGGGKPTMDRYLTHDEFDRVCAELPHPYRLHAQLLAYTGMRWGESVALRWDRVDVKRGMLLVHRVWDEKNGIEKDYPKGKRRRPVPIPPWLLAEFPEGARNDFLSRSPDGDRWKASVFRWRWDGACRAAGVGHVRIHDARHTYASWLIQAGVALEEVGRLLGHMSPATTQRYAHLGAIPTMRVLNALPDPRAAKLQHAAGIRGDSVLSGTDG